MPLIIKRIKNILQKDNRYLMNVFSLNRDDNVAETIFKAIFGMNIKETKNTSYSAMLNIAELVPPPESVRIHRDGIPRIGWN
jgi:hypothetical protein